MLDKLDMMIGVHREALNLREQRQQILATNIANNDTPGYQARDINFAAELKKASHQYQGPSVQSPVLTVTSARHIGSTASTATNFDLMYRVPYQPSADGNTVDMDKERTEFADNSVRYQGSLTFLGGKFKSLMSVMQQG